MPTKFTSFLSNIHHPPEAQPKPLKISKTYTLMRYMLIFNRSERKAREKGVAGEKIESPANDALLFPRRAKKGRRPQKARAGTRALKEIYPKGVEQRDTSIRRSR